MAAATKDIFSDPLLEMLENDVDEAEDTLSLCDLPIYSDPADWEDADRSLSSSSDDDQEFFEFSSEASNPEAEIIIFCGKLIPYRERPITTQKLENQTCPKQSSNKRSIQKVGSVLASPAKSRWYRYMFGLARFPMEMELRDIKDRQSRHGPKPMFQSPENGGENEMVRSRGKGWWGMLRLLGCKSTHHASTVVKSFTCI